MAGDLHIRNVWMDNPGGNYITPKTMLFALREAFKVSDWVEDYFDADSAWTSNILLSLTDLELEAANPTQVYSLSGGFTSSHENKILAIEGNQTNRGLYNIKTVIDTNTALIDLRCREVAWADETGITARVVDPAANDVDNNKHIVWREPTKGFQVDFWANQEYFYMVGYPYGDRLTTSRNTSTHNVNFSYVDSEQRFNLYLGDPVSSNYFCTWFDYCNGSWLSMAWGELSNTAVGDDYAFFFQDLCIPTNNWNYANYSPMYMLNDSDTPASAYPYFYKRAWDFNYADWREREDLTKRINNKRAKLFRPQVILRDTSVGQFMRGNHPMEFVHRGWPNDEFGTSYWKMGENILFPRNGPNDPQPLASTGW